MNQRNKLSLSARILTGMGVGAVLGLLLNLFAQDVVWVQEFLVDGLLGSVGRIFIISLQMLVVPLVFVSLVCGTASLSDPGKLGRLGGKAIVLYLLTTALAISLGIFLAALVEPGKGVEIGQASFAAREAPPVWDVLVGMFPKNPVQAMAEGNMLQIIVFSILFGVAMALSGEPGRRVAAFFGDLNAVVMELVVILMNVAPYGVFALMAKLVAGLGLETFLPLLKYFFLVLAVLLLHGSVTYPLILKLLTGLNPLVFLKKLRPTMLFAFSTASSNATLPVTLRTVTGRLGVSPSTASFTVPLGATINMDGTAIMQGVATVFIAQAYGMDLSLGQYVTVVLMATLASVGTAGVPGVGLVLLATVLTQVGLPVEGIGIIIGVDRLLDMTRTAVNVTGDSMVSVIVDKSEGGLDEQVFNDPEADLEQEDLAAQLDELEHERAS